MNIKTEWLLYPICGRKTHNKIREDTELKNFPLYCPKCRQETLVDAKQFIVSVCEDISEQRDIKTT